MNEKDILVIGAAAPMLANAPSLAAPSGCGNLSFFAGRLPLFGR
jgi:hypothetical protein